MKKENKKQYTRQHEQFTAYVYLKPEERSVLEIEMAKEKWGSVSGYIRHILFDDNPDKKINKIIEEKIPEELVVLLKNAVLDLASKTDYFRFRYEKDMAQLYREEGVDINKWIKATNDWHARYVFETQRVFSTLRKIARALELDDYFSMPSDNMKLSENPTQEEMDRMAEQLRIERIALGYNDDLYL